MLCIPDSHHWRAATATLYGALAECRRIRKTVVVENVIYVKTLDTCSKTVITYVFHGRCVHVFSNIDIAHLIVIACLAIEKVNAYL